MALFDRFGRGKRARRPGISKPWWEVAEEFLPETLYAPTEDFDSEGAFDPMGSYTGIPEDGGEPVQDADDL